MSAPSLSMAATTSTSSSLCNRLSNLFSYHSLTPLPTTHFPSKTKYLKPLKIQTQNPNFPTLSLLSLPHFHRFSSIFDSFEVTEATQSIEQEDPEIEEYENPLQQEEEEEQNVSESSGEVGRLYVGNLPYVMTSSQLGEIFGEAGRVVSVEIVYDRVTDRSRGFAFVTMGSIGEAKEAIMMFDGSQVGGRTVKVNFPEVPRGGEREVMGPKILSGYRGFIDSPHKIYAGNLGWSLSSQGLRDAFADQPGLLSAKVIYERNSGRSRGFGFVTFESAGAVESALNAMNGVEVEGRPLRLNMAVERAPIAPPELERNTENDIDSSEFLSSISL